MLCRKRFSAMRQKPAMLALIAVTLSCNQQGTPESSANRIESTDALEAPPETSRLGEPGRIPEDRNLISEEPVDPRSAEGAAQVLRGYAGLLQQRRFAEARRLWFDAGRASELTQPEFAERHGRYAELQAEIGEPGPMEGAAGSVYVEIPLRLHGRLKDGELFNSVGMATLRRVNDVPGSTEEQRQWRIYRMDMQPPD